MEAKVIKLFRTNISDKMKEELSTLTLDENGVIDDKFYAKDEQRAILITSLDSYILAKDNGIDISFGSLGENILIDINPYHLSCGDTLKIGDATLQITQNCTLCKGLSSIDSKLPKLLRDDRGIFAKLINPHKATIKVGDFVSF